MKLTKSPCQVRMTSESSVKINLIRWHMVSRLEGLRRKKGPVEKKGQTPEGTMASFLSSKRTRGKKGNLEKRTQKGSHERVPVTSSVAGESKDISMIDS